MGNIRVPSIFTEYHSNEVDLHVPGHEELLKKMAMNNNFLLNLMPIGSIIYINATQIGVTLPNINYWQLCDGSEITNPNSPLRTIGIFNRFTPNFNEKYPRGANDIINNNSGGTNTHNLDHTHSTSASGGGGQAIDNRNKDPASSNIRSAILHTHGNLATDAPVNATRATKVIDYVRYTAKAEGSVGNDIRLNFYFDVLGGPGQVSVSGSVINVSVISGITTASQVKGYVDGNSQATSLVSTELTGNGSETHNIIGARSLTGGKEGGTTEILSPKFVYLLAYMKVV